MNKLNLNKLEKEIYNAMAGEANFNNWTKQAAQVAIKWIEKALRDGSTETFSNFGGGLMSTVQDLYVKKWMEENVLTE